MTIKGLGIDIEEIKRFSRLPYRSHRSIYKNIFTAREIKYCLSKVNPAPHFAARFAGKEAVLKALGESVYQLKQFEILNDKNGSPQVKSQGSRVTGQILVSLAHTKDYAIAFALWQN